MGAVYVTFISRLPGDYAKGARLPVNLLLFYCYPPDYDIELRAGKTVFFDNGMIEHALRIVIVKMMKSCCQLPVVKQSSTRHRVEVPANFPDFL